MNLAPFIALLSVGKRRRTKPQELTAFEMEAQLLKLRASNKIIMSRKAAHDAALFAEKHRLTALQGLAAMEFSTQEPDAHPCRLIAQGVELAKKWEIEYGLTEAN